MPRVKINLPSPGCALSILCRVVKLPNTQSKRGPTREGVKAGCVCVEGPATLSMISTAAGKSAGGRMTKLSTTICIHPLVQQASLKEISARAVKTLHS